MPGRSLYHMQEVLLSAEQCIKAEQYHLCVFSSWLFSPLFLKTYRIIVKGNLRNWVQNLPWERRLEGDWGGLYPHIFWYCEKNLSCQIQHFLLSREKMASTVSWAHIPIGHRNTNPSRSPKCPVAGYRADREVGNSCMEQMLWHA